jgi:hypothetical protein
MQRFVFIGVLISLLSGISCIKAMIANSFFSLTCLADLRESDIITKHLQDTIIYAQSVNEPCFDHSWISHATNAVADYLSTPESDQQKNYSYLLLLPQHFRSEFIKKWIVPALQNNARIAQHLIDHINNKAYNRVRCLLRAGIDPNVKTPGGKIPLLCAVKNDYYSFVHLLLYYNAHIDTQDQDGATPLIHATLNGNKDLVELLLEYNPNLFLKTTLGNNALYYSELNDIHYKNSIFSFFFSEKVYAIKKMLRAAFLQQKEKKE